MSESTATVSEKIYPTLDKSPPPTALVIFGATGDLAKKKLLPALKNISEIPEVSDLLYLYGFGRKALTNESFRDHVREIVGTEDGDLLEGRTFYHQGGYDAPEAFRDLKNRLRELDQTLDEPLQVVFYLSTPPNTFEAIAENLHLAGLANRYRDTPSSSKIILEKPFGHDLESSKSLNDIVTRYFWENQIFRIDHYLGKETVQDLLVLRFANSLLEPIWNHKYIDFIEITVAESIGVGSRGSYYDESGGCLRDMIQNHLMQLLSLTAMEPPASSAAEDIRNEKVKFLQALGSINPEDVVRGQYQAGTVDGEQVPGYREEPGVNAQSSVETFTAMKLTVDNWRWHGVPFYLRSGKRLGKRVSEIVVHFKSPPGKLFRTAENESPEPNQLIMHLQPDAKTTLTMNSKIPGPKTKVRSVEMDFEHSSSHGIVHSDAYERLLLDAISSDNTLFIRADESQKAWELCDPLLKHFQTAGNHGLATYEAGSWGPEGAKKLLAKEGHTWRIE